MFQERQKRHDLTTTEAIRPDLSSLRIARLVQTLPPASPTPGHSLSRIATHAPQTKLSVTEPGDSFEQEADSMADKVMRAEAPGEEMGDALLSEGGTPGSDVQRKESGTAAPGAPPDASGAVSTGLSAGGQSLDPATRAFMEPQFGHDFSQVKIHTDAQASQSTEHLAARAYTLGSDIAFRSGEYNPGSAAGKHLLAHGVESRRPTGAAKGSSGTDKKAQRKAMRSDGPELTQTGRSN